MAEKVTRMLIKVDLQCWRCYKKIKKILCKFPQIRDQMYDEKQNAVLITVVCCSPEKIRDKIICKGGETVQSVVILPDKPEKPEKKPEKPKEPEKKPDKPKEPKEPEKKPDNPKEPEKKPEKPKEPEKKPDKPEEPEKKPDKPKEPEKKPEKPKEPEKKRPPPTPAPPPPVVGCPPIYPVCWCPCYGGYGGGPCYCGGHGRPVMCYDGCGRPAYECQGGNKGYYVSRCDYFSEENPTGCTVM